MTTIEIAVTIIGVAGSLFGIYEGVKAIYNKFRKKPLDRLMNELVNKNTPLKKQRKILHKMQCVLIASGVIISNDYIKAFNAWKNRSRLGQCAGADWDTFDAAKLMIFSETVAF